MSNIFKAVKDNDTETIEYLIKNGVSIDVKSTIDTTPLIKAIKDNNQYFLVKNGTDINILTSRGGTPILYL